MKISSESTGKSNKTGEKVVIFQGGKKASLISRNFGGNVGKSGR